MKTIATTTVQTVAQELASAFESSERNDGKTFYKIRDDAAEWTRREHKDDDGFCLMLKVHRAVDDRCPDDWIYEHAKRIADRLAEYEGIEEMRESVLEIVDSLVYIYNADLTAWLAQCLANIALCDEAVEEMGVGNAGGVLGAIQSGQFMCLDRIAQALITAIEIESESRDGEAKVSK